MNTAYLKNNIVVRVAPEGWVPPQDLDYDVTADGTGASVGATWDGVTYTVPPIPAEQTNHATILENAEKAMAQLRAFRDLASPTTAQKLAFDRLTARILLGLIRVELGQMDDVE